MAANPPPQPPANPPPLPAAFGADLANALAALAQVLQQQQQANAAAAQAQPAAHNPVLDPYSSVDPFDLASRAGAEAFKKACQPLSEKWDGTIQSFPPFLTALRVKANEANWNAPPPQGILFIDGKNILIEHHSITMAQVTAAQGARVNPRAIQNARAMYYCLKDSITGTLYAQIFQQVGNLPLAEDGVILFKQLTVYTVGSLTQLSMIAIRQILDFDPAQYEFDVPTINTELSNLFMLATSNTRVLPEPERVQHTLDVYSRIRQPEEWATWVRNQVDAMDMNGITLTSTAFMNAAVLKYKKICAQRGESGFGGSTKTVTEDVVAMLSKYSKKGSDSKKASQPKRKSDGKEDGSPRKKLPRFIRYDKDGTGDGAKPHKVGDYRVHDGDKWYFCDCPNHKDGIRWHTHTAEACRTRKKWLENKADTPQAHVADDDEAADNDDKDEGATGAGVVAMLANALPQLDGLAKERVIDALAELAHD